MSDLHLGDGSSRDDFLVNSGLFLHILERHYLKNGFKLVLNGDIEELQKFPLKKIVERWRAFYDVLHSLHEEKRLYKLVGNHDFALVRMKSSDIGIPCSRALRLGYGDHTLFIFHGHQASYLFERCNVLSGLSNRFVLYPLNIKNFSVAHDSTKKRTHPQATFRIHVKSRYAPFQDRTPLQGLRRRAGR